MVLHPTTDVLEGQYLSLGKLAAYFYTYNGIVVSNQPERLQRAFDVLTDLFDQIGLRTNTRKMVSITCQPCHMHVWMSLEAY